MQYDLQPLSQAEVAEYLDFRLVAAGGVPGLFSAGAISRLHDYSAGIPRKINHAASLALLEGFGREARLIDETVLDCVMLELDA
jgi:type II secretory pathway predicted ATPase ExeA